MRLLIVTDVFPPICGGSGWSAYELARGLRAHGHELTIVRPRLGGAAPTEEEEFDGFRPVAFSAPAPGIPFVRNWFRNERFWPRFAEWLDTVIHANQVDLVHAQHALSAPPSVTAARRAGIPSVCTIRDYWPLCYWTDLMLNPPAGAVCPGCTPQRMSYCLRPRAGAAWPLATPFIPYMQANLQRKQRALAEADALIAISRAVAKTFARSAGGTRGDDPYHHSESGGRGGDPGRGGAVRAAGPPSVCALRRQAGRQQGGLRPVAGNCRSRAAAGGGGRWSRASGGGDARASVPPGCPVPRLAGAGRSCFGGCVTPRC